jgi:putative Mg2+ transporter-C (MgtC) family protein
MENLLGDWQAQLVVVGTCAYAMLLGGAIGVERELKNRPAGFRTHMLIAGAAALLIGLGEILGGRFGASDYRDIVRVDPIGLIQATVAAVGFLGAGTIFRSEQGSVVTGITTAASLLMAATIGIAAGLHKFVLAFAATLLTLIVLMAVSWIERRFGERKGGAPGDGG